MAKPLQLHKITEAKTMYSDNGSIPYRQYMVHGTMVYVQKAEVCQKNMVLSWYHE